MRKFQIGDRVRVRIIDSIYDEKVGKVIGYLDLGFGNVKPTVELNETDIVYFREEELELVETVVEYEYAVQRIYESGTSRNLNEDDWMTEERAKSLLETYPKFNHDPTWGTYNVKLVKRRKAGRIEDV